MRKVLVVSSCAAFLFLATACTAGAPDDETKAPAQNEAAAATLTTGTDASPETIPEPVDGPVELSRFGGCCDATIWARNGDESVAVVIRFALHVAGSTDNQSHVLGDSTAVQVDMYLRTGLSHLACSYDRELALVESTARVRDAEIDIAIEPLGGQTEFEQSLSDTSTHTATLQLSDLMIDEWEISAATSPLIALGGEQQLG
ncbi:MAG: hypothetical protein ACI8Y4_003732 [Candidatus Poriferisodalaceae bacterium]